MSETKILTKSLRDGSRCDITIEPAGEAGWQLRVERAGDLLGVTKARPFKLDKRQGGVTHTLVVIPGQKGVAIGLTRSEAESMNKAIDYFVAQQQKAADAKRKEEQAALTAQLRAAAPDAPTWTISDPYGVPGVGKTMRLDNGQVVTGLKTWQKYYREDGLCFGAAEDSGYVYYAEVREATPQEAAPVLREEERIRRRDALRGRIETEIVKPAERPASEGEIPDLLTLPEARFGEPLVHLRVDRDSSMIWVLNYNGADGDN